MNKTENTLCCACSPESIEETVNWYDKCYDKSIIQHKQVIANIIKKTKCASPFFISFYPIYQPQNKLEKRLGMAGVFGKYGIHYVGCKSAILPYDKKGMEYLISIADASISNFDIFFCNRVYTILCFARGCTANDLLIDVCTTANRENILSCLGSKYLIISFNDTGCDGNSILIQNYSAEDEIFKGTAFWRKTRF